MPAQKNTPQSRKRPRPQGENSSPSISSTASKRPRLDVTALPLREGSPSPVPSNLISSAINGALSFGRRIVSGARAAPAQPKKTKEGDLWEIPDSGDERQNSTQKTKPAAGKRSKSEAKKTTTKAPPTARYQQPKPQPPPKKAVWDVPDSDDDSLRPGVRHSADDPAIWDISGTGDEPRTTVRNTAAVPTPKPSSIRKNGAVASVLETKGSAKSNGSARGGPGRSTKRPIEERGDDSMPSTLSTSSATRAKALSAKQGPPREKESSGGDESSEGGENPGGKENRRRESSADVEVREVPPPVKRGVGRPRKVEVNGGSGGRGSPEGALSKATGPTSKRSNGAKPAAPKKMKPAPKAKIEEEEEDDEVCTICSRPDSKKGNEILFCDDCDAGYHQRCVGLTNIPKGDWTCPTCSKEKITSLSTQETGATFQAQAEKPDIPNFEQHLRGLQRVLLDRCTGRRRIKLIGQDEAYEKAYQLVEQTVVAGEGNSMLVMGARGCGKTTLIELILADLARQQKDQFHVVRLNGFIHTDDKLALREIWRQLGKEMQVEDDIINKTNSHADTMASLLALLSHPSEIAEAQDGVTSKSVVFIIDEFDLFATHPRQTLLYNLFDVAQARKAPIAVLGLTTKIDVVESLEKRVKSRFSHRYVYLSLPKSLPAFWDVCKQGLSVDEEDMAKEGIDAASKGHKDFWQWWNSKLEDLRQNSDFQDHLEAHFYSTKSVAAFLSSCILPISSLSPTSPSPLIPTGGASSEPPDSKLHVLEALSELDLSMLIAAARLDIVAHTDTVNFAMAYDEYTSLMSRQRVQSTTAGMVALGGGTRVWGRGIASMSWERLITLGMLIPAATVGRGAAGQSGLDAKMWKVDVALEEIPAVVKLNAVLGRWCEKI